MGCIPLWGCAGDRRPVIDVQGQKKLQSGQSNKKRLLPIKKALCIAEAFSFGGHPTWGLTCG